jgi:hypothetical protein
MAALFPSQPESHSMRVRRVDVVASLLNGSLIVAGALVFLLAAIWMLWDPQAGILVDPISVGVSGSSGSPLVARGLMESPDDVVLEPLEFEDQLSSVAAIASTVIANEEAIIRENQGRHGTERANGLEGDGRQAGPVGSSALPTHERWQIVFKTTSLDDYARQLDHFKIELGCVGGGIETLDYAASFSSAVIARKGRGSAEHRLYFAWREPNNVLAGYDRVLLQRAGIPTTGRLALRFIEEELARQLLALEIEHAQKAGVERVEDIRQTVFRSEHWGDGYRFLVAGQRYKTNEPISFGPLRN